MCSIIRVWPEYWQVVGVLGTIYGTLGPRHGKYEVKLLLTTQLLLGAEISWVALVLVLRDTDLYYVQI